MFEEIRKIMVEQLGVEAEEVKPESLIVDDLGADSLDVVELIMAIEDKLNVEIPDGIAEKMKTVGDITDYLESNQRTVE